MADKVEVQISEEKWEERTSKNILEEELTFEMRCCGKDENGNQCHVSMVPVKRGKPKPSIHFRQKNGESIHILGCSCDKQRKYRTDNNNDRQAAEYKPEDLWSVMRKKEKQSGKKGGKKNKGEKDTDGNNGKVGGAEPKDREIRRRNVLPKTPESLAAVLLNLSVEKEYANTKVGDLIIDYRTLNHYRLTGIVEGRYIMVIAKKLAPVNRIFVAEQDEIVLADCKYDASKEAEPYGCMQFRMKLDRKAQKKMRRFFKMKAANMYIVIFSRWEKDPDNENVYFALDADRDHIGCIRLPQIEEE